MTDDGLTPEQAQEVLRRATELDASESIPETSILGRDAVVSAAAEAGIAPEAVSRALAELDAGGPAREASGGVLGPATVTAERVLPGPTRKVRVRVERWLTAQTFETARRTGAHATWRRRDDMLAKAKRVADLRKRIRLQDVEVLTSSVVDIGDGRCLVRITASHEDTRKGVRAGSITALAGVPVAGGAASLVTGNLVWLAAGIPGGPLLAGSSLLLGKRMLARLNREAGAELERFLDTL